MKAQTDRQTRAPGAGFTLIELIMVIAILALIAVVAIQGFGNLKERQARKMNAVTIAQTQHALATYDLAMDNEPGRFNDFDSLLDVNPGGENPRPGAGDQVATNGTWKGTPGVCVWKDVDTALDGIYGVYDGHWKGSSGEEKDRKMEQNRGTRETGLLKMLGIYYLQEEDVKLLRDAGISRYVLHTAGNRRAPGNAPPGFRPDESAYYSAALKEGSPVVVLNPLGRWSDGEFYYQAALYRDLGYPITEEEAPTSYDDATKLLTEGYPAKLPLLICLGIGDRAACVHNQLGIGRAPLSGVFDKTHYRNYIAVFALSKEDHDCPGMCRLAGVIDCEGNTWRKARHKSEWRERIH